jgi:hypothetical protein
VVGASTVSAIDVDRFRRDGFLRIPKFTDDETVDRLRTVYDQMLSGEISCAGTDRLLGGVTRQIMEPSLYHPVFRKNRALALGQVMATALFGGTEAQFAFSMLIYKGAGDLAETPWHQDYAYAKMPFTPAGENIPYDESVQFWVPLDDVDPDNGCMYFLPGGHLEPLQRHYVAGGEPTDDGRLLAIEDPENRLDLSRAVACSLPAGGATIHSFGTPHFTPGNRTKSRPRRAYIFNFARNGLDSLLRRSASDRSD